MQWYYATRGTHGPVAPENDMAATLPDTLETQTLKGGDRFLAGNTRQFRHWPLRRS